MATKAVNSQTCGAVSNSFGEWRRVDLVGPTDVEYLRRLILQPEDVPSIDGSIGQSERDEMVIYYLDSSEYVPTTQYARIDKRAYLNKITTDNLTRITLVSEY